MNFELGFCKDALHVGLRQHGVIFELRFAWIITSKSVLPVTRGLLSLATCPQSIHSQNMSRDPRLDPGGKMDSGYTYAEAGCFPQ